MPVIPYCVFSPETNIPDIVTGVAQSTVERLSEAGVSALYSEVAELPKDPGELTQSAMAFQSVVQQLFGAGMVIPFRFPTLLADVDALREHLRERSEAYRSALERFAGMAQMDVRISRTGLLRGAAPASAASGTDYLRAKQAEAQSIQDVSHAVRESAGELVREWKVRESDDATRCFVLIRHEDASEFKRRVGFVRPAGGVRAVISGPWPPSEFLEQQQ